MKTTTFGVSEMGVTRSVKTYLRVNKVDGFDCQSCAWPSPDKRKVFEFCENGAKAMADELTHRRVDPAFFASTASRSSSKSRITGSTLRAASHPMIRREHGTHFEPISWEEAFGLIGTSLRSLATFPTRRSSIRPARLAASGVSHAAPCTSVRNQQSPRLLEHVSRVERNSAYQKP